VICISTKQQNIIKMKKILTASFAVIILLSSCKNSENKSNLNISKDTAEVIVQENEALIDDADPSDTSFINAVDYYKNGKYSAAADYIEWGILQIRQEEKPTGMTGSNLLIDKQVKNLRSLEDEVRNNKIEDINDLTQAMANAEMLVAHDYMIYSIATLTNVPVKSSNYFDKALKSLDKAILKLDGNAKIEAEKILYDSKGLKEKLKSGANVSEKDIKEQVDKIEIFLKNHKSKWI